MIALKFLVFGFIIKIITGFDDTITHVPILASVTRTRIGRIAFSIGTLAAVMVAIIIAIFFSSIFRDFIYSDQVVAGIILLMAFGLYFNIFVHKPRKKAEQRLHKLKKISIERFTKLLLIGFITSLATVLDDIIAFLPLFIADGITKIYSIIGILTATILEILLVIYLSKTISKIKYKEKITATGLVVLAALILLDII